MKKIGFINPSSGHAARGIGYYVKNLIPKLLSHAPEYNIEITQISDLSILEHTIFDIIHYPYFDLFTHSLPIFSKSKVIVNIYDVIPLLHPDHFPPGIKGKINLQLQKLALRNVSAILTDSYSVIGDIVRYLHVPHSKIKLIYLAPGDHFQKNTFHLDLPNKFILYVGDINFNKNLPLLIRTAHQNKYNLIIVGKNAANIPNMDLKHTELIHLKDIVKLVSTSPYIKCLGYVSDADLVAIYNQATVYCQPSYSEGFGLAVLEAMACGTPVITSDTPTLIEISGDAALHFDPNSQASLEQVLHQVYSQTQLRARLSKAGLSRAKSFSWDKTALETLNVYNSI